MKKNTVKYQIAVLLFGIALIVLFNRCQKTSDKSGQIYTATEAKVVMLISKAKANHSDSTVIYLKEALGLIDQLKQDSTAGKYLEKISTQAIYLKDSVLFNNANAKAMALALKGGIRYDWDMHIGTMVFGIVIRSALTVRIISLIKPCIILRTKDICITPERCIIIKLPSLVVTNIIQELKKKSLKRLNYLRLMKTINSFICVIIY